MTGVQTCALPISRPSKLTSVTPWLLHIIVRLGTCRYRVPVHNILLPIHFTHLHITIGLPNVCRRHGILANLNSGQQIFAFPPFHPTPSRLVLFRLCGCILDKTSHSCNLVQDMCTYSYYIVSNDLMLADASGLIRDISNNRIPLADEYHGNEPVA